MFEKIVLAIDGSEASRRAVGVAAGVAKRYGDEVVLIHVREKEFLPRVGTVDVETPYEAMQLIDSVVRELKDDGVSVRAEVLATPIGRVAPIIVETAQHEDAGLIVMGTRGLSDWSGLFLGSVTHRVLHLSEIPVLIVP
jgi:nucleotide-binding universal stress UspA family protein